MPFADWTGRRVLITGASGFVGWNLCLRLQDLGARLHLLARPSSVFPGPLPTATVHHGDLAQASSVAAAVAAAEPDTVFHLAVPRGSDAGAWSRLVEINVQAALALAGHVARRPATRLVVAGSSTEYLPSASPHREDDPLAPVTWHGVGKAAASMIFSKAAADGLSIAQLRLFHVYGPWEPGKRLLPTAILAALQGRELPTTENDFRRDWVYVDDVVEALLLAGLMEHSGGRVLNVGSGVETGNAEVVKMVEAVTGRSIRRRPGAFASTPADSAHRCADITSAAKVLGWHPRHDLAAGIAATLAWHRAHPQAWQASEGRSIDIC